MDVLSGQWWRFGSYELAQDDEVDKLLWIGAVIRPSPGATGKPYSPEDERHRLGHRRAAYNQLADVGFHLREWYLRRPEVVGQSGEDFKTLLPRLRAWEAEALVQSLHSPVLEWCSRFGLLGVPSLYSAEYQATMRRADGAGSVKSRQDDIATLILDPQFWRTYTEGFSTFAFWAVVMHNTLRSIADADPKLRAHAFENLNLMLENVGLVAREQAGGPAPAWTSTSLLGYLAAAALFDISNGVRIGICKRCGRTFLSRRDDKRTCSERCREAEKMKRRREDPAFRAHELERQRAARRNAGPSRASGHAKRKGTT
jgi:hypothetical protein